MPILIDTCYFVALANFDDKNHEKADQLLDELLKGKWGARITLDYVLDEAITVSWIRTKNKSIVKTVYDLILGEKSICLLHQFPVKQISNAWEIFLRFSNPRRPLSFTDCVLLSYAKNKGINNLISFDDEFDGIISRIG
ncbi:MAG: type II toxin-antitoxin system VapC family toxin [Candidatus Hodarchaeales archaeon]